MSIFSRLFRKGQDATSDGSDGSGSGMKKCSRCGAMWEQGAAFCGECGAPIAAQESANPPAPQDSGSAGRYSFTATEGAQPAARSASSTSQTRPSLSEAALAELFSPNDPASADPPARVEAKPRRPPPPTPKGPVGSDAVARPSTRMKSGAPNTGKRPPAKPSALPARPPPPPAVDKQAKPAPAPAPAQDPLGMAPITLAPLSDPAPPDSAAASAPATSARAAARADAAGGAVQEATSVSSSSAPPGRRGNKKHSDHGFQKMLDDLDEGFETIVRDSSAPNGSVPERLSHPVPDVRELFQDLAADFARPVRDFMIEMKWSDPRREWIDICLPAVRSLKRSAETMEMSDLVSALTGYQAALEQVASSGSAVVDADAKEPLARAYDALAKAMPDGFSLEAERDRREPIIVQSLLLQVPEVRKVTLDKLYAAGLTRLEMYFVSKPEEIAGAAGLDDDVAKQIVDKFRNYRREIEKAPDEGYVRERQQLRALTDALAEQNVAYDRAASDWSKEATTDKRRLRQEREETLLSINVMLARLGEVDRVRELEKLPFHGKVRELESFLEEAAQRSRANRELSAKGAKAPGGGSRNGGPDT